MNTSPTYGCERCGKLLFVKCFYSKKFLFLAVNFYRANWTASCFTRIRPPSSVVYINPATLLCGLQESGLPLLLRALPHPKHVGLSHLLVYSLRCHEWLAGVYVTSQLIGLYAGSRRCHKSAVTLPPPPPHDRWQRSPLKVTIS